MNSIVLTVIGQDKPGLVDSLANAVYQSNGNWVASNFANMAGQFAGFVEVQITPDGQKNLIENTKNIDDLIIQSVHVIDSIQHAQKQGLDIEVMGNDRPGIVQEITRVLSKFDLNILHMTSSCQSAPNWGNQIFKANFTIEVKQSFEQDELTDALEAVANDVIVDIKTHQD